MMKKIFTLTVFLTLACFVAQAQLPDGSIAPDFTAKDIDGNEWNLYQLLDEGKTVILDFSATWCGPCWSYHQSGALETLYDEYGPGGTGEMFVFMIESDADTELDCLYDEAGCTGGTQGDWVEGTHYPIIDEGGAALADLFEVGYYPTIYHVCQNRIITEAGQVTTAELFANNDSCLPAFGDNNAGILKYEGFSGSFCGSTTFAPALKVQNLGNESLSSLTVEMLLNGVQQEQIDWTGSLSTFGIETITFSQITLDDDTDIEFKIALVNGVTDEDTSNDSYQTSASLSLTTDQNVLTLEILTDQYGTETYWELLDANGNAFYSGGNALVVNGADNSGAYLGNTLYTTDVPLPGNGCFEFVIYDAYGDGICCTYGDGYYRLKDPNGNVIIEGGSFLEKDAVPFRIDGAQELENNGAIVFYGGGSGQFCGASTISPTVTLQNLGANAITQMVIDVNGPSGNLLSYNWTGNIASGGYGAANLGTITVTETPITIEIISINGEADAYPFKNTFTPDLSRHYTEESEYFLELQLDFYAFEIYWQLQSSTGEVIASGGNENVGINGGGLLVAGANDPGAYGQYEYVVVDIAVPSDVNDCYEFILVDDYGDGLVDGGGGYAKLSDNNGNVIFDRDLTSVPFTSETTLLDANPNANATKELEGLDNLAMFPNPVADKLNVRFNLAESKQMQVSVFNVLGQQVSTIADQNFAAGSHSMDVDVSKFNSGVYYLRFSNDGQLTTKKFTVVNN